MTRLSRRSFLKLLPALPFYKVAWPYLEPAIAGNRQDSTAPNILFLVFDTLTAKHVSLHGYDRNTTPNLARFAERATVFHQHRTTANFTSPATASIFTGTNPWTHRAFHLHGVVDERFAKLNIFSLLPDNYYKVAYTHNLLVTSLLHQFGGDLDLFKKTRDLCLSDSQWADQAFPDDYSVAFWAEWLFLRGGKTPPSSLFLSLADRGRRFATKRELNHALGELFPRGIPNLHSLFFILEDAVDWIQEQVKTMPKPFFGYFHLLPPHEPYNTRRDFIDVFKDGWQPVEKELHFSSEKHPHKFLNRQRREYDEFLAYTDAEFGRLYDALEEDGRLDNTYFVVTSDHGELFERGIRGHVTMTLYDPLLHVPLLISKPGQRERVDVHTPTSGVDLLPTFLQATGQPIPDWCEGEPLPTFGDAPPREDRSIFALEAKSNPKQGALTKHTAVIVKNPYKLIQYTGYPNHPDHSEMYNLADDPEELHNLFAADNPVAVELQDELNKKIQKINEPYLSKK
ncbi:MAG: sulfatase-like hydrolase/transferase [Chloroflexi bacterium]|nr:sulfatase-like hydrolase/transferase [Chloroflexota bacterium]